MVTTEAKSSTTTQSLQAKAEETSGPFFEKDGGNSVLTNDTKGSHFFDNRPAGNNKQQPFFSSRPFIQTKLTIGQPGDKYEKEADSMADQVVQRLAENNDSTAQPALKKSAGIQRKPIFESESEPTIQAKPLRNNSLNTTFIQPKCAECEEEEKLQKKEESEEEEQVQMKPIFESAAPPPDEDKVQRACAACEAEEEKIHTKSEGADTPKASSNLESRLQSSKGGGSPLSEDTRSKMEGAFGSDFSGVRVHTDSSAVQMNKDLHAHAFAHGNDIYFNAGKYDPSSSGGKHLLAHELTHTVQQNGGSAPSQRKIQRWPNWVSDAADWVSDTASDVADTVVEGAEYVGGKVADGATWVGGKVAEGAEWVGEQLSAAAEWLIGQIRSGINSGMTYLNEKWERINEFGRSCFDDIKSGVGNLINFVTSPLSMLMSALSAMSAGILGSAWSMLKSGANALWTGINAVVNGILQVGQGIWNTVSGFVDGVFNTIEGLFNNATFDLLPDFIKTEVRSLFNSLKSLWTQVSTFWTDLWQRLTTSVQDILAGIRSFVDNVIAFGIEGVIKMVRDLKEAYDYVMKFFGDPRGTIQPFLDQIAAKLNTEVPPQATEKGNQMAQENYPGSAGPATANGSIQRQEADSEARDTASLDEVGKGILYYLGKFWDGLNIKEMLWQTVVNSFWPPATIEAICKEFSDLWNDHWATTVSSLYAPRNFFDDPIGCLHDIWSNFMILLEFPLSLWRTLNHVAGLLIGYITIIVVVVEAVLGGIAAAEVGVIPGLLAGAGAGLATMAPVAEALMASYLLAESSTVIVNLVRLYTARQTCEKRQVDISNCVTSFITMAVALVLQVLMSLLAELVSLIASVLKGSPKSVPQPVPVETPTQPPAPAPTPAPAPAPPAPAPTPVPPAPAPAPVIPLRPPRPAPPAPAPAELPLAAKFEDTVSDLSFLETITGEKKSTEKPKNESAAIQASKPGNETIALSAIPGSKDGIVQTAVKDNVDPDACKKEECPAPKTSAPGIGRVGTHGSQPPRNRTGPLIHHTQSEHIIPFATARSLRLAVGLTERARRVLARFDAGMITIMIYRGAAEGKNAQDNVYSAQFEADMMAAQVPTKTEQARRLYEGGDIAGGEALAREVVSSVTSALDTLRESAVGRTNQEIEVEWIAVEKGCKETNGQRRSENDPVPKAAAVTGAADQQLDSIIDLVTEALLER